MGDGWLVGVVVDMPIILGGRQLCCVCSEGTGGADIEPDVECGGRLTSYVCGRPSAGVGELVP